MIGSESRAEIRPRAKTLAVCKTTRLVQAFAFLVAICLAAPAYGEAAVNAPAGRVRGAAAGDVRIYRGLPYAVACAAAPHRAADVSTHVAIVTTPALIVTTQTLIVTTPTLILATPVRDVTSEAADVTSQ